MNNGVHGKLQPKTKGGKLYHDALFENIMAIIGTVKTPTDTTVTASQVSDKRSLLVKGSLMSKFQ